MPHPSNLTFYLPLVLLLFAVVIGGVVLLLKADGSFFERIRCVVRQLARRWQWGIGVLVGLCAYPYWYEWRVAEAARRVAGADAEEIADAAAAMAAKMVDPEQFYSKLFVATTLFAYHNLCVWGTLVLVYGVIGSWAKGAYVQEQPDKGLPAVPDFKHTFLGLSGPVRMAVMLGFIFVESQMIAHAVDSAFKMQ